MVICIVPGCCKRSDRDKDVSFFRLPTVRAREDEHELSKRRQAGYLLAIKVDLSERDLSSVRICSRHFITGKPAYFHEVSNPDWLPTQNLTPNSIVNGDALLRQARYLRRRARSSQHLIEPAVDSDGGEKKERCTVEEAELAAIVEFEPNAEEVETTINAEEHTDNFTDACTQMEGIRIPDLQTELNCAYETIRRLECQIVSLSPFTESSFQLQTEKFIQQYTGLQ